MITHETYECEICGQMFETEEECIAHELRHDLIDIFTSGAKFFDYDGVEIELTDSLTCEQFCDKVMGIVSPSGEVAKTINHIYNETGYCEPFDNPGTDAHRIVYIERYYNWFNADAIIDSIKKKLGE